MLVWPAVAVLGFLVLNGLVIALGTSSTARFDFERNRVHDPQPAGRPAEPRPGADASAAPSSGPTSGRRGAGAARAPRLRRSAAQQPRTQGAGTARVATHPAGSRLPSSGTAPGWWLVDPASGDGAGARLLAGPFADRLEADWAALSAGLADPAEVHVVHGVRTASGALLPRPTPPEGAWMVELGEQLTRLGEDWFDLVSDTDPLTTLVVEVTEALLEAGLPLHDCSGSGAVGGVCLTPHQQPGGILVSWQAHERMSLHQLCGADADAAVRRTMSAAVADVLVQRGFAVEPLGWSGGHLVTAARG